MHITCINMFLTRCSSSLARLQLCFRQWWHAKINIARPVLSDSWTNDSRELNELYRACFLPNLKPETSQCCCVWLRFQSAMAMSGKGHLLRPAYGQLARLHLPTSSSVLKQLLHMREWRNNVPKIKYYLNIILSVSLLLVML